ncbi:MAG TPA: multicopper oxidase family protein [Gammaproteobacteria bacterium]|nr:multicopper oxidase family protein [Gammaproteobacteria bacterium]
MTRIGGKLATTLSVLALAGLSACGERGTSAPQGAAATAPLERASAVSQPAGWDQDLKIAPAQDLNPDPHVLEVNLEAKPAVLEILPGKKTTVWTYNGQLPGPLLRAQVGDRVIVHFKNSLPVATTIHWHGLRVSNDMDGSPGITQPPVEPGGEFRYEFVLKDAGTYWYHPHVDSAVQVGRGLYGPIVVEDPKDPQAFGDDLVLVLSDMSLDEDGQPLPDDNGGQFGDLFGREGSTLLVNGKVRPHLQVRTGKQQRWRVIDAARARYFNLRLPGHRFTRLGGDNGLAARSEDVYNVVVAPGERADAVFTPADPPGSHKVMQWVPVDRGYGSTFNRPREDLFAIDTVDAPPVSPEPIPETLRTIEPIDISDAKTQTLAFTIALDGHSVVMGFNGLPYERAPPLEARLGETDVWTLVNDTDFAHPFHLHGYFFQILDDARVPEWKDTISVPSKSQMKIAVKFDERPGMWMYHCHILDHAEIGMMGHLHVTDPAAPASASPAMHMHMHMPAHAQDAGAVPTNAGSTPSDGERTDAPQ